MGVLKRNIGDKWTTIKKGIAYVYTKNKDGKIVQLSRDLNISPYKDKSKINQKSKISHQDFSRHLSEGMKRIEVPGSRKIGDKNFKSIDRTFNPDIHIMVPHSSGKGFVQKLKTDIK